MKAEERRERLHSVIELLSSAVDELSVLKDAFRDNEDFSAAYYLAESRESLRTAIADALNTVEADLK